MNRSGNGDVDDERPGGAGDIAADDGNAGSGGQYGHAVDERIDARDGQSRRQHERQKGNARRRAHRRKVAQIDGERLVADVGCADERLIEVYAFDLAIGSQNFEPVALGLYDCSIVANADNHEWRRRWDAETNALDERALSDIRHGRVQTLFFPFS